MADTESHPQMHDESRLHPEVAVQGVRLLAQPGWSLSLLVFWLVLVGSVHPRMVLIGAVLALLIPLLTGRYWPTAPRIHDVGLALRFGGVFLWDIVVSSVQVTVLILRPSVRPRSAWLAVPLELTDAFAIVTLASVISLTPGTVSCRLDGRRRTLLVHALDVDDTEAAVALLKSRYERPLLRIFEGRESAGGGS